MKELETKILDIDLDKVRNKIKNLNLENVKCENQVNNLFDFPSKTLLAKKGYARVRFVEDLLNNKVTYYMTTKKMISQDKFKVMEEVEIEVNDGEEAIKLFESLGLELVGSVKKYRESYRYKSSLIEIDINDESFCPFPYIEVETSTEEELKEVVELLGYTMEDTSSKTIYDILNDKGITPKSPSGI